MQKDSCTYHFVFSGQLYMVNFRFAFFISFNNTYFLLSNFYSKFLCSSVMLTAYNSKWKFYKKISNVRSLNKDK